MQKKIASDDVKRVNFSNRIDETLYWELKHIAIQERKELYVIFEDAIRSYVEKWKPSRR